MVKKFLNIFFTVIVITSIACQSTSKQENPFFELLEKLSGKEGIAIKICSDRKIYVISPYKIADGQEENFKLSTYDEVLKLLDKCQKKRKWMIFIAIEGDVKYKDLNDLFFEIWIRNLWHRTYITLSPEDEQ
jgi:hypothetical protein